jgi:hypothetical protein
MGLVRSNGIPKRHTTRLISARKCQIRQRMWHQKQSRIQSPTVAYWIIYSVSAIGFAAMCMVAALG